MANYYICRKTYGIKETICFFNCKGFSECPYEISVVQYLSVVQYYKVRNHCQILPIVYSDYLWLCLPPQVSHHIQSAVKDDEMPW